MSRQNSRIMKSTVSLGLFLSAAFAAACTTQTDVKITFYGYPDNDPPSANIAYDCGRGYSAGGRVHIVSCPSIDRINDRITRRRNTQQPLKHGFCTGRIQQMRSRVLPIPAK